MFQRWQHFPGQNYLLEGQRKKWIGQECNKTRNCQLALFTKKISLTISLMLNHWHFCNTCNQIQQIFMAFVGSIHHLVRQILSQQQLLFYSFLYFIHLDRTCIGKKCVGSCHPIVIHKARDIDFSNSSIYVFVDFGSVCNSRELSVCSDLIACFSLQHSSTCPPASLLPSLYCLFPGFFFYFPFHSLAPCYFRIWLISLYERLGLAKLVMRNGGSSAEMHPHDWLCR